MKNSLLQVLDELLLAQDKEQIQRIVLSTTLVTNLLATVAVKDRFGHVARLWIAYDSYERGDIYFMKGAVD